MSVADPIESPKINQRRRKQEEQEFDIVGFAFEKLQVLS
jgi:hypothetical protein